VTKLAAHPHGFCKKWPTINNTNDIIYKSNNTKPLKRQKQQRKSVTTKENNYVDEK
jgi:hypothetical protein